MGRVAVKRSVVILAAVIGGVSLSALRPAAAWSASSGMQPYTASNSNQTFSTTSATYGTATASIQQSSGQSTTGSWTYCANHAVDGTSCPSASHVPAGTVSSWVNQRVATLVTMPGGAQCYSHTNASGVTWCYGGESVQDSIASTGGPFSAAPDTTISEMANQGEAWWGSGGGPNDSAACRGMFDNAPTSSQASYSSCVSQFGTVTWDPSGGTVASVRSVADEMAWRIGAWNGNAWPGGVQCASRTAIGGTSSDSQAPNGLWMQWSSNPDRGFWNCTQEDGAAGPPQQAWNGNSWYSRSYADWNGFGWYLQYYDYASFIETPATTTNGVATSLTCGGYTSATTVTSKAPSAVEVSIDESNGTATFSNQDGTTLSQVSCTNGASPPTTTGSGSPPPPGPTTTAGGPGQNPGFVVSNYMLNVPVGQTGAVNVLAGNTFRGTPSLSIATNSPQPGTLNSDPSSVDFGYFVWSPTYVDREQAQYRMCDPDGCGTGIIFLNSDAVAPTSTTTAPPSPTAANYTLHVQVGTTGTLNVLQNDSWTGAAALTLIRNDASQPGSLNTNGSDAGFGTFSWSPTRQDVTQQAAYQLCDDTRACSIGYITLETTNSPPPTTVPPGPPPTGSPPTTQCTWYCGQSPPPTTGPPPSPRPSPNVTLAVSPTAYPTVNTYIRLDATASNPASPNYDLRIVYLPDHQLNVDCGHVLSCQGMDSAGVATTKYYVAELVYSDGTPTDYSNEVAVTWGGTTVALTACLTKSPCNSVTAEPAADQPAFLTAQAYNPPQEPNSQPVYAMLIIDDATREVVGRCPAGETVCQVQVVQPGGVKKTYFADFAMQNNSDKSFFSNTVDVAWGAAPTTTTPPPPTTSPPPTSPPTPPSTSPPPPPTTTTTTTTTTAGPPTGPRPT